MRLFGGDRLGSIMDRLGVQEGEVITHGMVTKAIERAQKKVEAQNFSIRKHTLEYDDVMNVQRKWIYERRLSALERESIKDEVVELIEDVIDGLIAEHCPEKEEYAGNWNMQGYLEDLRKVFLVNLKFTDEQIDQLSREDLKKYSHELVMKIYTQKEGAYGEDIMRQLERYAVLSTIDRYWRDHLSEMDELRAGIGLRAYHGAMGKPIDIYKREAFHMFEKMITAIDREIVNLVYKLQVKMPEERRPAAEQQMVASHADSTGMGYASAAVSGPAGQAEENNPMAEASQSGTRPQTVRRSVPKVGRNDPCPCGSGIEIQEVPREERVDPELSPTFVH